MKISRLGCAAVLLAMPAAFHAVAAKLPPLPAFRMVPHLETTEERQGELSLVTVSLRDRDGRLCQQASDWIAASVNGGGRIVGVGRVGDKVADLARTNAVRLAGGQALVVVQRPAQPVAGDSLSVSPVSGDFLGGGLSLRDHRDVKGVWIRAPKGGVSYEVPAAQVTNDFEIVTRSVRPFNLFTSAAEPLEFEVEYRAVGTAPRKVRYGCRVYDWDGKVVFEQARPAESLPGDTCRGRVVFESQEERGIYFAEPYVLDDATGRELVFARTHLVRLPPHEFKSTPEDSIFGMASYWDVVSHRDTEMLMDRFGVRWMRYGDARLQHSNRAINYRNGLNWRRCMWAEAERDNWVRAQFEYCAVHGAKLFEFGNEINLAVATIGEAMDGIGRCDFADQYISWVKTFDRVMKEQGYDKDFGLLGFGMAGFDHAFATRMREAGILPMLKGFCIHPPISQYVPDFPYQAGGKYGPPERPLGPHPGDYPTPGAEVNRYWNFLGTVRAAKAFIDKYAPGMPLWVTEMYSSTKPNFIWGPSMRDGADNVVLQYALLKSEGVKVGMYYMFSDSVPGDLGGIRSNDREYTFGLLNRDGSFKPAALGYCAIAEALDQAECRGWMKMADPQTHGLLFTTPRGPMAVLWARWDGLFTSRNDPDGVCRDKEPWQDRWPTKRAVALPANGKVTRIDAIGRAKPLSAADGKAEILLDGSPCIVYGLDVGRIETY